MKQVMFCELLFGIGLLILFSPARADVRCYVCSGCNYAFNQDISVLVDGCMTCKKFTQWGYFSNTVTRTCELSTIGEGCSDDISGLDSQTCYCRTDYCNSAQNVYSSRVAGLVGLIIAVYFCKVW